MSLSEQVRRVLRHDARIAPGTRLVVAVSGGADSLVLLHILHRLHTTLDLHLHVATLDHGLRGDAGAADVAFVREAAAALHLPLTAGFADVPALAAQASTGIEAAARRARYDFLAGVARENGAQMIATGHHAGDQAETVLMHILRGSGTRGLGGMRVCAPLPGHAHLTLIRPLLGISRAEIAAYCAAHGLNPRDDHTNADTRYLRNDIRLNVLPFLKTRNPNIVQALNRLAQNTAADEDFIQSAYDQAAQTILSTTGDGHITLHRAGFAALHPALQSRMLIDAVTRLAPQIMPDHDHVRAAVALARRGDTGAQALFPGGIRLRVDYAALVIEPHDAPPIAPPHLLLVPANTHIAVTVPGRTAVPGADWALVTAATAPTEGIPHARLAIPPGSRLTLRTRRPGDRFGTTRKLKKWMIDRKLPQALRDRVAILEIDGRIAMIFSGEQWPVHADFRRLNEKTIEIFVFVDYS